MADKLSDCIWGLNVCWDDRFFTTTSMKIWRGVKVGLTLGRATSVGQSTEAWAFYQMREHTISCLKSEKTIFVKETNEIETEHSHFQTHI